MSLADVEAAHGFVFGTPDQPTTDAAPVAADVSCPNGECERQNRRVQLHADTVRPVHCGKCGHVLLDDPNADPDLSQLDPFGDIPDSVLDALADRLASRLAK
jgi:hypothetical protein